MEAVVSFLAHWSPVAAERLSRYNRAIGSQRTEPALALALIRVDS
jgi:hypothetical protein